MTYDLSISAKSQPEILERILRVIRQRGFRVSSLTMEERENDISVDIKVTGDRDIDHLGHQLNKIIDVQNICIK